MSCSLGACLKPPKPPVACPAAPQLRWPCWGRTCAWRLRRGQSLRAWALRLDVSVPTLIAMERGQPTVGVGVYATALWLMGRHAALEELAAPAHDAQALAGEMLLLQRKGTKGTKGTKAPKGHA